MRRKHLAMLATVIGALTLASTLIASPATQALSQNGVKVDDSACTSSSQLKVSLPGPVALNRINNADHGLYEFLRAEVSDGEGVLATGATIGYFIMLDYPNGIDFSLTRFERPRINPMSATVTSIAGNELEAEVYKSPDLYCANLPGSIKISEDPTINFNGSALHTGNLNDFVTELSGSPVTFQIAQYPSSIGFALTENGAVNLWWTDDTRTAEVTFTVRNAAGQTAPLTITILRGTLVESKTTLVPDGTAVVEGDAFTASATVTGASGIATGSVRFSHQDGTDIATVPIDSNGVASLSTTTLPIGESTIIATYTGDGTYKTSSSEAVKVTVTERGPETGETDCPAGQTLNDAGDCVDDAGPEAPECIEGELLGVDGKCAAEDTGDTDGEGIDTPGGEKPNPGPQDTTTTTSVEKSEAGATNLAFTGDTSPFWAAGAGLLAVTVGVSLIAFNRRRS